jgi:hypothetical protein
MPKKRFYRELLEALKRIASQSLDAKNRPCYVNDRRAVFHRWINSAHPVLPRGIDANNEKVRFFQFRSTHGLVEYEDGTLARVWPQEIRFADGGFFEDYSWIPVEQLEEHNEEKEA